MSSPGPAVRGFFAGWVPCFVQLSPGGEAFWRGRPGGPRPDKNEKGETDMEQTTNYQLPQWEATDRILMEDFNGNNAKIDAAIKAEAEARAAADTAEATARQALAGQVAKLGNCQLWTTSYTGTEEYGVDNPTTLTFPKKPILAIIESGAGKPTFLFPRDGWMYNNESQWLNHLSWSGNTASWYIDSHTQASGSRQLNGKGITYYVTALLDMSL